MKPKPSHIRIWPETIDYLPALIPFQSGAGKDGDVHLDFSNCTEVNATGLTILLIKIIDIIGGDKITRKWGSDQIANNPVLNDIDSLGFFYMLSSFAPNLFSATNIDMFISNAANVKPIIKYSFEKNEIKSYPIYHLSFNKEDRRMALARFRQWLLRTLEAYNNEYNIPIIEIITILTEMAKNSADHTEDDAFFGLDIIRSFDGDALKLNLAFGDIGVGIKERVAQALLAAKVIDEDRAWHFGHAEAYYHALQEGFTTNPDSDLNMGLGMTIIINTAKKIGLDLSVFDAESRAYLTAIKSISHSEIRKQFYKIGNKPNFCYFGKLKAERYK